MPASQALARWIKHVAPPVNRMDKKSIAWSMHRTPSIIRTAPDHATKIKNSFMFSQPLIAVLFASRRSVKPCGASFLLVMNS
jgi:hypothetical protein